MAFKDAFPRLGFGVGLRTKHYSHILEAQPAVDWFEVISENFMVGGGRPLHVLEQVRARYPIVLHGVSLSIGTTDPLDRAYLRGLKALADRYEPAWVSDHLCWTGVGGRNLHDLLPIPYTEEALTHIVERVAAVQDALGRPLVLENVSSYLTFRDSVMHEWEFLAAVAERADCGLLLDVNNVFVSAFNHRFDANAFLAGVPVDRVVQFHLAGHSDHGRYLLDTHDHPIRPEVWDLYAAAVRRFGVTTTLVEWDDQIPDFPTLHAEALRAKDVATAVSHAGIERHATVAVVSDHGA